MVKFSSQNFKTNVFRYTIFNYFYDFYEEKSLVYPLNLFQKLFQKHYFSAYCKIKSVLDSLIYFYSTWA